MRMVRRSNFIFIREKEIKQKVIIVKVSIAFQKVAFCIYDYSRLTRNRRTGDFYKKESRPKNEPAPINPITMKTKCKITVNTQTVIKYFVNGLLTN
jgi:hypothetical protein